MQINKKIFSIAITALLLLSVLAIVAPASAAIAAPTLTPATGPVGTRVTVAGTAANPFGAVNVYWDNLGNLLRSTFADNTGAYSVSVTVPSATAGAHFIVVQDSLGTTASATFTVTTSLSVSTTPATSDATFQAKVLPGDSLTLRGNGYAGSTATTTVAITVTLTSTTLATPNTVTITTPVINANSTGSWTATIVVPNTITVAQYDTYTISATDGTNTATATILISYYDSATPASGPPGITVSITGRIPPNTAYTVSILGPGITETQIATGTSSATGAFTNTYVVPSLLAVNTYTIKVAWSITAFVTTSFAVTPAPTIGLFQTPYVAPGVAKTSGVAGELVTIVGINFVPRANVTLYFGTVVVNSTAADSRFGPTSASGGLTAEFTVPSLTPGTYVVTVVDQYGASASAVGGFTINAAPVTIVTTSSTFVQGDTISFTITTTDPAVTSVAVMIKDPTGVYWWGTPDLALTWNVVPEGAGKGFVPYWGQLAFGMDNMHLTLPANAPLGAWNWTITLPAASTSLPLVRTGLFTVAAVAGSDVLTSMNSTINQMNATINGLSATILKINSTTATIQTNMGTITTSVSNLNASIASISGNMATLNTNLGTVTASLSSLGGTITGISSSVSGLSSAIATVQTTVGAVQTKLGDLDPVIGLIAGDTTTLKTSVGTITTSLSTIGTQVTGIVGDVATIKTDLGTLTGTVTSISGNVATIQTNLGTMQADISALKTDVTSTKSTSESLSPLIIVAIVLALIAAIAAIASIVLMRRKIAG